MDERWGRTAYWSILFIPVFITAWLFFPLLGRADRVQASLTPVDAAALEACLSKIASGTATGMDVSTCSNILATPNLPADWTGFFRDYFSDHPFNEKLWEYITGPMFWGQGNEAILQAGLTPALEELITQIVTTHPADLGPALSANPDTRETLLNAHRVFAHIAHYGKVSDSERQAIFSFYISHINAFPQYWKKSTTIDSAAQPYVAAIAAQIHSNLRDLTPLTDASKNIIAQALDLQGRYRDIWQEFSVLLYDNNGFDTAQRESIYHFFTLNPKALVLVPGISQMEMLGNGGSTHLPILLGGVNVFGTRVGQSSENPFPSDGANYPCDLFGTVVAHEDTHVIFANYVSSNMALLGRHNLLIQQAGTDPANYLRGGSPGFFYNNPQEFLASIANQWFCSSADTVHLGIDRFLRGNPHGINQALFFAEVMSLGSSSTWLYTNTPQGNLTRQAAAITRNSLGYIDSIALPDGLYHFEVNSDAMVTRLWVDGAKLDTDPAGGITRILKPGETGDVEFKLRNTGQDPLRLALEPDLSGLTFTRGALQVDGRSGVRILNSNSLNPTTGLTIEAWVDPLTWENPPFSNGRILQKGYSDNQYRLLKEGSAFVFDVSNVGTLRVDNQLPALIAGPMWLGCMMENICACISTAS